MYSNLKSGSRKALAVLLSILMVLSLLPISVLAESLKADNLENGTIDFAIAGFDGETELEQVTTATLTVTKDGEAVYSKEASGATMEVPFAEVENYLTAEYDWVISAPTYDDYALNVSDLSVTEVVMVKLQATFYTVSADEDGNSENVKFADGFTGRVRAGESVKFTIETSQKDPQKVYTSEFYYTMGDKLFNVEPDKEITTEPATGDIKVYAVVQENNIGIDFEVAANSWTNDNSIDVSANDSDYELYYSTSADGSNKQSAPIALSTQGENTFYVWGEKTTGLIFKKVTKSDVIEYKVKYDASAPVVDSATLKAGEENYEAGAWANEDVTLSAVVSDAYSGVKTVELYNSKSEKVDTKDVSDGTYTYTFAVESNKALNDTFTLKVIDSVGFVDDSYTAEVKIDKAKPVISNVSYKAGDAAYSGAWVNQDVVLTADVADADSGLEKVAVYQGDTYVADMVHQSGDSYSYTFSVETGKALEGSYTIKAIDKMDNAQISSAQDVKIDKINPEVTFAVEQENTDKISRFFNKITFGLFFNPDVKIILNPVDKQSGVASTTLILERDGVKKEYTATDNKFKIDAEIAKNDFGIEDLTAAEFKFSISAKVADNAGNEILNKPDQYSFSGVNTPEFMLEKVVPTTDLKVGETAYDELGDTWLSDNAALTIGAQDANSGIFKVEVKDLNDPIDTDYTTYTYKYGAKEENPVNTKAEEIKLNTSFFKYNAQNGTYNFTVQVMDNCGNVSALATYEIKKDLNAPQITNIEYAAAKATDSKLSYDPALIKNEEGYFGYFFKEATAVTLSVSDSLFGEKSSGIADVVVKLVDFEGNETTPELNKADLSNVTFTVATGFKGYIFAYAVDNAGNSTVKEDGTAADISYEGKAGTDFAGTDGENALANRDAYNTSEGATNWVSAEYAQKVVLSAEATEFTAYNGWISAYGLIAETDTQHGDGHKEEDYQKEDGNWFLVNASADNHVALYRQEAAFKDHAQTNPDTLFYKNDVKLKVVVKDTFNGIRSANVTFTPADKFGGYNAAFSIDDAALASRVPDEIVDGWTVVSNKENLVTEISKEITVPAETAQEYTFIEYTAEMTDMSGNESAVSDRFSVDVTAPETSITVNDEAYATTDAKWYADNVKIEIISEDVNSGIYSVVIKDNQSDNAFTFDKADDDTLYGLNAIADGEGKDILATSEVKNTVNTAYLSYDAEKCAYSFDLIVTDNCGNEKTQTYTIKKDLNAPQVTDVSFNPVQDAVDANLREGGYEITTKKDKDGNETEVYTPQIISNDKNYYGFFFQQDTNVTITAKDNLFGEACSGITDLVVKLVDFNGKEVENLQLTTTQTDKDGKVISTSTEAAQVIISEDGTSASFSFTVKAGFKGYIYAYAVDAVGNSTMKENTEATDLSYQGKDGTDFADTDESIAQRNEYNNTATKDFLENHVINGNHAINWISSAYANKLHKTEFIAYAGYVSAYGLIAETQEQHNNAEQHIRIDRNSTYFHNVFGDLYNGDVAITVTVTDTLNGIRDAQIKFKSALDFDVKTINEELGYVAPDPDAGGSGYLDLEHDFDIDAIAVDQRAVGHMYNGWEIMSVDQTAGADTNIVTEIQKTIIVRADKYESNDIKLLAYMTDMGLNKSDASDQFSIDITDPTVQIVETNGSSAGTGDEGFYNYNRHFTVYVTDANFYPSTTAVTEHFNSEFMFELEHKGYNDNDYALFKQYDITTATGKWELQNEDNQYKKSQVYSFEYVATEDGEYRFSKDCLATDSVNRISNEELTAYNKDHDYKVVDNTVNGTTYYNLNHFYVDTKPPVIVMNLTDGVGSYARNNVDGIDYFKTPSLRYDITLNDAGSENGATSVNYATYFNASGTGAFAYSVDGAQESGVVSNIALASRVSTASYSEEATGNYDSFDFEMSYSDRAGNPASYTYSSGGSNDFANQNTFKLTKVCPDNTVPKIAVTPASGTHGVKNQNFDSSFTATDKNLSKVTHSVKAIEGYKNNEAKSFNVDVTDNQANAAAAGATVTQTILKTLVDKNGKYDGVYDYTINADDRATNVAVEEKGSYVINGRGSSFFIDTKQFIDVLNGFCVQKVEKNLTFTEYTLCDKASEVWAIVNGKKVQIPAQYLTRKVMENIDGFNAVSWVIDAAWFNTYAKDTEFVQMDVQIYLVDADGNISYLISPITDAVDPNTRKPLVKNIKSKLVLSFALDNEAPEISVIDEGDAEQYNEGLSGARGQLDIEKTKDNSAIRELNILLTDKSIQFLGYKNQLDSANEETVKKAEKALMELLPAQSKILLEEKTYDADPEVTMEKNDEVIFTFKFEDKNSDYLVTIDAKDSAGNTNYLGNDDSTADSHTAKLSITSSWFVRAFVNVSNFVFKHPAITIIIGAVVLAAVAAAIIIPVLRKRDQDPEEAEE